MSGDLFSGVVPFVHLAQEKSFNKAARRLGVTTAAVSKAIATLEESVGVRLVNRTSRTVALTPEGEAFLERCREAVAQMESARAHVQGAHASARGTVTVSLPYVLGRFVVARLPSLTQRFPELDLDLRFTDRFVQLVEEGVDVVVRIGELEDSALVRKGLRRTRWVTVASPAYLARRGTPQKPEDLARHDCLHFRTPRGTHKELEYLDAPGGKPLKTLRTRGTLTVDYGEALLDAAAAGLGIAQVMDFLAAEPLRKGSVVQILGDHDAPGPEIHALTLPGRQNTSRIRAFLQFLVEAVAEA